jgi:hypothetical protein
MKTWEMCLIHEGIALVHATGGAYGFGCVVCVCWQGATGYVEGVKMEVPMTSRHFVHIFKLVNNVSYRGVLDPIYHSKHTFRLRSNNRTQFYHGKELE